MEASTIYNQLTPRRSRIYKNIYKLVKAYCNDRLLFYVNKRKIDFRKRKISRQNQENATLSGVSTILDYRDELKPPKK